MDMHHLKSYTQPVLTQVLTLTEMSSETIHTANLYTSLTLRHVTTWNHTHTQSLHTSSYPQIHYCLKSHIQPEKKMEKRSSEQVSSVPRWTSWLYKQCQPATKVRSLYLSRSLSRCLTSASWPCPWPLSSCPSPPLPRQNWNTAITSCM